MKKIWNSIPKSLRNTVIVLGLIVVGWNIIYPTNTVRYKVTVTVETPEGEKTGSAVRELKVVQTPEPTPETSPHTELKGEAVVIDLGKRGVAFAVMGTDDFWILFNAYPDGPPPLRPAGMRYLKAQKEKKSLELKNRPLIVMFKDMKDPKTVTPVYRVIGTQMPAGPNYSYKAEDNFAALFGAGVRLKDISIETTKEPVTRSIQKYLPSFGPETGFWEWLGNLKFDDPRRLGPNNFM